MAKQDKMVMCTHNNKLDNNSNNRGLQLLVVRFRAMEAKPTALIIQLQHQLPNPVPFLDLHYLFLLIVQSKPFAIHQLLLQNKLFRFEPNYLSKVEMLCMASQLFIVCYYSYFDFSWTCCL
jgi:hypothetical protein